MELQLTVNFLRCTEMVLKCATKKKNPYTSEDRSIIFMSDPPHLMKMTRNCWSHSHGHGNTRDMWVCFQMCICTCIKRGPPPPKKKKAVINVCPKQHVIHWPS